MKAIKSYLKRVHAVPGASLLRAALAALYLMSVAVFPSYAAPSDQSSACQWRYVESERFFPPPRTKGDMDFMGHGPQINATVEFHVMPDGIYADVYMKAEETRRDKTTAEGSKRLMFLHLQPGEKIARVAEGMRTTVDLPWLNPLIPINPVDIANSHFQETATVNYVDKNHDADYIRAGDPRGSFSEWGGLIRELRVVGDTYGPEAGTKTGIGVRPRFGIACVYTIR